MEIFFISLFPEAIESYNEVGMMKKASENAAVKFHYINLREFGLGPRHQVDDTPYGGGDGMVLKPEPIVAAINHAKSLAKFETRVIVPTPRGKFYTQNDAKDLALKPLSLIIVCPRYEGYDERIMAHVDMPVCIGSYVLTGGEIPAMLIADSVVRLLPGVLGGAESVEKESFQNDLNLIEHPQYTRPAVFEDQDVPAVLLNGNHAEIEKWRENNSTK